MPSEKKAALKPKKELIKCEVLKAVGIDATEETLKEARDRANSKGLRFTGKGLTTMIYPNKPKLSSDGKKWLEPEPVFIEVEKDIARRWQNAGAVKVVI